MAPTPRAATPSHPWQRFGPTNDWLAFLDVDEFLVPRAAAAAAILADPSTARAFLPTLLAAHAGAAALAVHWVMFGTSGHVTRPAGGTLAAYTRCTRDGDPENSHVKSVVAPARTRRAGPDYATALAMSMQFYHAQKSGSAPAGVSWRGDCFMHDGNSALAGGWLVLEPWVTPSLFEQFDASQGVVVSPSALCAACCETV